MFLKFVIDIQTNNMWGATSSPTTSSVAVETIADDYDEDEDESVSDSNFDHTNWSTVNNSKEEDEECDLISATIFDLKHETNKYNKKYHHRRNYNNRRYNNYNQNQQQQQQYHRRYTHVVQVGLMSTSHFDPLVKILCVDGRCKPYSAVTLSEQDWYEFNTSRILLSFENFMSAWNADVERYIKLNTNVGIVLRKGAYRDGKMVQIASNGNILNLSVREFRHLCAIGNLIQQKLDVLRNQAFSKFYGQFVAMMREALSLNLALDVIFYTQGICQNAATENNLTMLELTYLYPQVLLADVARTGN